MKKFLKVCLIIALILVCAGLIISIVGVATGGATDVWGMMRRGELSWSFSTDEDFDIGLESQYDIDDVEIFDDDHHVIDGKIDRTKLEAQKVTDIRISIGGGQLFVDASPDDNYYIEASDIGRMQVYVEDERLVLKGLKDVGFKYNNAKIWLYLPEGIIYEDVEMELGAGRMEIMPIEAENVAISAGAGEVEAENFQCKTLKMEVGAGQITLEDCRVTEKMETSVGAGRIQVEGTIEKDLTADCAMGSTEFTIYGQEKDHNYELSCAAGSIRVGDETLGTLVGDRTISNDADSEFKLDCVMGSIQVDFID